MALTEEYKKGKDVTLYVSRDAVANRNVEEISLADKFKIKLVYDIEVYAIASKRVYITEDYKGNSRYSEIISSVGSGKLEILFDYAENREVLRRASLGEIVIEETNTNLKTTKFNTITEIDSLVKALGSNVNTVFTENYVDPTKEQIDDILSKYGEFGISSMHLLKRNSGYLHYYVAMRKAYDYFVNTDSSEYLARGGIIYIPAKLTHISYNNLKSVIMTYKLNEHTNWISYNDKK